LELNELAHSPILATCIVETTSKDASLITENGRVVPAHATLRILRTFPQNAIRDRQINLDFEAHPEGDNGMSLTVLNCTKLTHRNLPNFSWKLEIMTSHSLS
jgi:hypothetical protein